MLLANREQLVDSARLYNSLSQYALHEKEIAFDTQATDDLGAKRKAHIIIFGYSPRNVVHCVRLCCCGAAFFNTKVFPTNIMEYDPELGTLLLNIKTSPQKYKPEDLRSLCDHWLDTMVAAYDNIPIENVLTFNPDIANEIMRTAYLPLLSKNRKERIIYE